MYFRYIYLKYLWRKLKKKMETSEDGLLQDDGMQAPLLANEELNQDEYRMESTIERRKNIFLDFFLLIYLSIEGVPTRYVSK